ncbi:MAG TPA: hypothetical protein VD902_20595 [Symbiobacteriaceae bacterium]|nr:hypothetical protein [Symbiobacteriaceae bacterium]
MMLQMNMSENMQMVKIKHAMLLREAEQARLARQVSKPDHQYRQFHLMYRVRHVLYRLAPRMARTIL